MKIDYFPITKPVAETIRKKAEVTFVLLCTNYIETISDIETVLNCDLPEDFNASQGIINVLFINNKIIVLGGLGLQSEVTKNTIKETLNKMTQSYELQWVLQDNPILMIYAHNLNNDCLESMRESMYELNGIHKMNVMIQQQASTNSDDIVQPVKDLFRHVFIAQ